MNGALAVPRIDKLLGIEIYATKTFGVGGVIREAIDDFMVEEVLVDGSKANIEGSVASKVLGSSSCWQRFLLCILVKRNWDTFIAIKNVAKQLGIDQSRIQFAGIKDAKAATAQHITIENVTINDVAKVNVKDIEVHPIGYVRDQLSLFFLLGNNFTVKIKGIKFSKATIEKRFAQTVQELEAVGGIPNFFGHQRFGTVRPVTHLIGKAIVKGDFEQATMIFLAKPSGYEHPDSRQARLELHKTQNFKQALKDFPKQLRFERLMLNHLVEKPGDYIGAFQRLPVKLQELFVQAHQSYLFNRFLSERVKRGLSLNKVEVGDFVVGVERSSLPMTNMFKITTAETMAEINKQIKAGKLRIALPLVGARQKLSEGVMGEIEKDVLEKENIQTDKLRINALSTVVRKGGLRTAVTPIKNFNVKNVSVNKKSIGSQADLTFMLLRGSYATIAVREFMKPSNPITANF